MRRSLWVAPVLALICLAFAATWLRSRMETAMRVQQESQLLTLLKADLAALELWIESEKEYVDAVDRRARRPSAHPGDWSSGPRATIPPRRRCCRRPSEHSSTRR